MLTALAKAQQHCNTIATCSKTKGDAMMTSNISRHTFYCLPLKTDIPGIFCCSNFWRKKGLAYGNGFNKKNTGIHTLTRLDLKNTEPRIIGA